MMFYSRRVYLTGGINSNLKDGSHIPMFDIDNVNIRDLETEALRIMEKFKLGDAVIINTGRADSYHLYFLTRLEWRKCLEIAVSCYLVDLKHVQFSIKRRHFTLRILPKANRKLFVVSIIKSNFVNTIKKKDITSFVLYETAQKK